MNARSVIKVPVAPFLPTQPPTKFSPPHNGIVEAEATIDVLPDPSNGIPTGSQMADAAKTADSRIAERLTILLRYWGDSVTDTQFPSS